MSNRRSLVIDIVGSGASGTLVLAHLSKHRNVTAIDRITVYDRGGRFAKGIAYSTTNPLHLLNVRANNMSGFPKHPDHLVRWLSARGHGYTEADFIPRMIYAEYLRDLWDAALRDLKAAGVDVQLKAENFEDQDNITILATGNDLPYGPQGAENLTEKDGYHPHPWTLDYGSIKGDVVIPGTGLSMIDTVMALHGAGFKGKITAISRNGLIPAPHIAPAFYPPVFEKGFSKTALGLLREIRRHVKKAAQENIPWQAVIDSLRPHTNIIWQALGDKERKKIRRLFAFWNIHRHRMAPQAAAIIDELKKNGTLKIVKDRVLRVEKGLSVIGRRGVYKADHVINCLGYGRDGNFKYDPETDFALGPVLVGYYFESVAIPEIRAQAEAIANRILQ